MPPNEESPMSESAQNPALHAFGAQVREVGPVVLDSVLSKRVRLDAPTLRLTSDQDLQEEYGGLPHAAIEARLALSETEAHLTTLLLPYAAVDALLGVRTATDAESGAGAGALLARVDKAAAEVVDLLGLMLFTDSPIRGEIRITEVRLNHIEESVGMVLNTAAGAALYRMDADLGVGDAAPVRITQILPETLLRGLVRGLTETPTAATKPPVATVAGSGGRPAFTLVEEDDDPGDSNVPISPMRFPDLRRDAALPQAGVAGTLDLILDVAMRVSVELGRSVMTVQELLALGPGSVVELDKLAGEPVDILVNDRLIARGEVVMVDENFGVRVTDILSPRSGAPPAAEAV